MEKEIYSPMEKILIEGATRLTHSQQLLTLLDYEMEQHIRALEAQVEDMGKEEIIL